VSRYSAPAPRDSSAPGVGFNVGGSLWGGLALAAVAGAIVGAALGFVGANYVSLPIVSGLVVGWTLKRALAAGAGGGTPDRGVVGAILFLAIVLAVPGLMRWLEYRSAAETWVVRGTRQDPPPRRRPAGHRNTLRILDTDADGKIVLPDGGGAAFVDGEISVSSRGDPGKLRGRLRRQLLASTGRGGFYGHLEHVLRKGDSLRLPGTNGVQVPGFAMVALWLVELMILVTVAYGRVE
jgi:hypothetical protein